jgi:hypothetical protein
MINSTTSSLPRSGNFEAPTGKQLFTLEYERQFDDNEDGWTEDIDWVTLKSRLRCFRSFEEDKHKKEDKIRKIEVARGRQECTHCAEDHKDIDCPLLDELDSSADVDAAISNSSPHDKPKEACVAASPSPLQGPDQAPFNRFAARGITLSNIFNRHEPLQRVQPRPQLETASSAPDFFAPTQPQMMATSSTSREDSPGSEASLSPQSKTKARKLQKLYRQLQEYPSGKIV